MRHNDCEIVIQCSWISMMKRTSIEVREPDVPVNFQLEDGEIGMSDILESARNKSIINIEEAHKS